MARWLAHRRCGSLATTMQVLRIPTFMVIIAQGIMGSMPWNALVFLTVYLQLIQFSDFDAAVVNATFLAGAALGGVLGGIVGDWAANRSHDHGRIWTCQVSVCTGIPFTLLLLKGLPRNGEPGTVALYSATVFTMGLVHVWAGPNNNSIFSEIVPPHLRNLIYAFDRCVRRSCCPHSSVTSETNHAAAQVERAHSPNHFQCRAVHKAYPCIRHPQG